MSSRKFAGIFAAIFILGALPLLLVQPSGVASAGLSAGFIQPVAHIHHAILLIGVGILAAYLGKEAVFMLPLAFLLMFIIGALLEIGVEAFPGLRIFILGAVLLFGIALNTTYNKVFIISVCVASSLAFHFGVNYISSMPQIASPLYFLIGIIINQILLLSTGVSLGLTIVGHVDGLFQKIRRLPAVASFLSLF